jgi:DNA-binding transcriptional LysR family regulator
MSWDDLRVFLAVCRRGSHKGAARLLGVDPTTVARRVAALEQALGARLFDRTPDRLACTEAGRALLPRAERIEVEVLASERELRAADTRLEGTVRITASDGHVHYVLVPALASLRAKHPALTIELRSDTRALDLSRREADIALRLVRPKEPSLIARRLATMRFAIFGSSAYLERRGAPRKLGDLPAHAWVGFDSSLDDLPQVKWLRRSVPRLNYAVRANATTTQVQACIEGNGLALLPTFVAAREPRLVPVLPKTAGPSRETWAVTHADSRGDARVRAVLAWIAEVSGEIGGG